MNIVEFLFAPWLSYYWTVGLAVIAVAFAIRAALIAWLYRRKLLCLGLASVALFGALFATVTAYSQFPPISIIQFLGAVALNFTFFVLGIERVQLEDIPVPSKYEVEKALSEGLRLQK